MKYLIPLLALLSAVVALGLGEPTGDPQVLEVPTKEALEVLKHSLNLIDSTSGYNNKYKVVKVISATSQVVSGVKYVIKALITVSDCSKTVSQDPQQCGELAGIKPTVCLFEIWDRPWLKSRETNVQCDDGVLRKYMT
ncbi:hypothetical protein BGZ83_010286 [Gryganskiella cystojenkinii]|nr:hypothetical protein BGZ83_010286 [Gryganskiella cystojenkinii]